MDPLTLFALANGAVSAVKAACKLYKDIKGAAGDIKDVLKDLDEQFYKKYEDKPVPPAAVKQLAEEKSRVKDLNQRSEETSNIYADIGDHLGAYYDNYFKCLAVLEEEEKRSTTEVYSGGDSLAKRALKRVLMKKQLEQMGKELRELMIYQSPPELGALFSDVEAMTKIMGAQQKILITKQMQGQALITKRRKQRLQTFQLEFAIGVGSLIGILVCMGLFIYIAHDAKQRWGDVTGTRYRDTLEQVRKQEWYEHQKKLKEYELFLQQQREDKTNEPSN